MDKKSAIFIIVSFLILIVMFHFIGIETTTSLLQVVVEESLSGHISYLGMRVMT